METRANFVLIGAFVLTGLIGGVAFVLWFAQVQLDRAFAYYDIRFDSVSGLSQASDVRFAGLPVGQVIDVRLSADRDGTVVVRIEVDAETPVRVDSVATIEAQGVTGVSFVGITAGSRDAALLEGEDGAIPTIQAGRSVLQTLSEDAPELITEVLDVARAVGEFLGEDNQRRVATILSNAERASEDFAGALDDFSDVSRTIAQAAADIAAFTTQLEGIAEGATATLAQVDAALIAFTEFADQAESTLAWGDTLVTAATRAFGAADAFLLDDIPEIVADLRATNAALRAQIESLGAQADTVLAEFGATGAEARARMAQAEATIAAADAALAGLTETLAGIDRTAAGIDGFLRDEATPLVRDGRAAITAAGRGIDAVTAVAEEDLPAIIADIRTATASINAVIAAVGDDLQGASGRIADLAGAGTRTLDSVADTFQRANRTLDAIEQALVAGEAVLGAAERSFDGVSRVIDDEMGTLVADLRRVMAGLETALDQVADDLPAVTADLRRAASNAASTMDNLGGMIAAADGPVRQFAATGLPQITRLVREAQTLVASLERVSRQLERQPSRFLLDRQPPEFRR